jgi:hypothetical protein
MKPGPGMPEYLPMVMQTPLDRVINANPHCGLEPGMGTFSHEHNGCVDTTGQVINIYGYFTPEYNQELDKRLKGV